MQPAVMPPEEIFRARTRRIFMAAIVVSVLAHLLALFGVPFRLGDDEELLPLQVHLKVERRAPPPQAAPAAAPTEPPPPPKRRRLPPPDRIAVPVPAPQAAGVPVSEPAAAAPAAPVAPAAPPKSDAIESPLPLRGRIEFSVVRASDNMVVGRAVHRWEMNANNDGRYSITAVTETTGLVAFFRPITITQKSEGRIAGFGLKPEAFSSKREGRDPSNESAQFDWSAREVTLSEGNRKLAIPESGQDLLSFIYQLAADGKKQRVGVIPIATGKKLESYRFEVLGEEEVELPAGPIKALHVRTQGEKDATDLWLNPKRHYLPVKIRYVDRKGDPFDQVLSDMSLEGE